MFTPLFIVCEDIVAIFKLESELGIKLFLRDKRKGLILTDAGREILRLSRQMEDLDNRIYQTAYKERNLTGGHLRIAVLTSLVSTIVLKALKEYRGLYPGIEIEIREGTPNDIFEMVEEHHVDLAVSCSPFGRFDSVTLVNDRIMAMFPPDCGAGHDVDLSDPGDMLIINRPAYETILDHITQKDCMKMERMIMVQNAETAVNMVNEGIGIGIISEYTMETLAPGHPKYRVAPEVAFEIGLFANDLGDLTPCAREFAKIIQRMGHLCCGR